MRKSTCLNTERERILYVARLTKLVVLSEFEEVDRNQNLCKGRKKERTKKGDQQALAEGQKYGN